VKSPDAIPGTWTGATRAGGSNRIGTLLEHVVRNSCLCGIRAPGV